MENKYLEKVASMASIKEGAKAIGRDFAKGWKRSSTTSKIGLGMSATGLGLGVANYKNGVESKHRGQRMADIEIKSLNELKNISESLKKKPKVTVNLRLQQEAEKQASLRDALRDAGHFAKRNPFMTLGIMAGAAEGASKTTKKRNESSIMTGLRGVKNTIVGGAAGGAVGAVVDNGYNKYLRK